MRDKSVPHSEYLWPVEQVNFAYQFTVLCLKINWLTDRLIEKVDSLWHNQLVLLARDKETWRKRERECPQSVRLGRLVLVCFGLSSKSSMGNTFRVLAESKSFAINTLHIRQWSQLAAACADAPFHCLCDWVPRCTSVCVCRPCKSHKETNADCDCSQFPFDVAKCVNFGRDYRTHTRTQNGTHVLLAGPSSLLVVPAGIFATPLSSLPCPALLLSWPPLCMKFFNAYANFAVKFCVQLVDSLTCNTDCHASLHTTPLLHTHTVAFGTTDLKGVNCFDCFDCGNPLQLLSSLWSEMRGCTRSINYAILEWK